MLAGGVLFTVEKGPLVRGTEAPVELGIILGVGDFTGAFFDQPFDPLRLPHLP